MTKLADELVGQVVTALDHLDVEEAGEGLCGSDLSTWEKRVIARAVIPIVQAHDAARIADEIPDLIDLFRIMRAAGRTNNAKAVAVHNHLTAITRAALKGSTDHDIS